MVNMTVRVIGLNEVNRLLTNLPKSVRKEVGEKAPKNIIFSAKRRIKNKYNILGYGKSKFSTGTGLKSISVKKHNKGYALLVAPYLALLDKPIRTHWVSREIIEAHQAHPGSTMFKKAPLGFDFTRPPILFIWKGPFITPSIKQLENDIPKILERATAVAIAEAAK